MKDHMFKTINSFFGAKREKGRRQQIKKKKMFVEMVYIVFGVKVREKSGKSLFAVVCHVTIAREFIR